MRPYESTQMEWNEVKKAVAQYPYCAPLQMLWLSGAMVWDKDNCDKQQEGVASLILNNKNLLQKIRTQAKCYEEKMEAFDVMKEINDYQEPSFKTAPKSVILSNFLEAGMLEPEDDDVVDEESVEVLAKKSVSTDISLPTETLAIVFEKQGKIAKAIEVYEKLILKYPEKSSTFASRIDELKTRL